MQNPSPLSTLLLALLALLALLSLLSLLTPLILGLRIFTISHRLNLLRLQKRADAFKPHIYTPFSLLLQHPDSESGITRHDLEATRTMRSARRVALFGPLACLPGFVAMPLLLYLTVIANNANQSSKTSSGTSMAVIASTIIILLVVIVHCSNASTVQHYFSLVDNEQQLLFGKEIKSATQERFHSRGLQRAYLTALVVLCGIGSSAVDCQRAARSRRESEGEEAVEELRIAALETGSA